MAESTSLEAAAAAAGLDPSGIPDMDLAFEIDGELPADLIEQAGLLAEPEAGSERWHALVSLWLAELNVEVPEHLKATSYCVGLAFVDDATMAELNSEWREKDGPTDVLAFAAQDEGDGGVPFPMPANEEEEDAWDEPGLELGDIVISLETAARQAGEHGNNLPRELLFLASHGLLHLLGWDHPDDAQLAAMLERQDRLIQAALLAGLA